MRSGPDQRPRGRSNGNSPYQQQPRVPQNNQSFDSNGSGARIRGNAFQIYERYLVLAREAATSDDRIAAENFYQHAEHYFRINSASRVGNSQETSRPVNPPPVETRVAPAEPTAPEVDREQPWTGDDQFKPSPPDTSTQ
jgi:Domain of unknown function (DUF4167)